MINYISIMKTKVQLKIYMLTILSFLLIFMGMPVHGHSGDKEINEKNKKLPDNQLFSISAVFNKLTNKKIKSVKCNVLKMSTPSKLPDAESGKTYSIKLIISGGYQPIYCNLEKKGLIPPGLKLHKDGTISGKPAGSGLFSFAVKVYDSCPVVSRSLVKEFMLNVKPSEVVITAGIKPSSVSIEPGKPFKKNIKYIFSRGGQAGQTAQTHVNFISLYSNAGIFFVRGEKIADIRSRLSVRLVNTASVSERLTVPSHIVQKAISQNVSRILYARTFRSTDKQIQIQTKLSIILKKDYVTRKRDENQNSSEPAAIRKHDRSGGLKPDLQLTGISMSFKNKGNAITIQKNGALPKLLIKLEYKGSGEFRGCWEVGNERIPVNRKLVSGKSMILMYPGKPILSTKKPGRHMIRFTVKSPETPSPLLSAEYVVVPDKQTRFVKGQIMVSSKSGKGERVADYIRDKYHLKVLESFNIKVFEQRITIFSTKENIFKLINNINKEKGVILAQPNHIFNTMSEPKSHLQDISNNLKFPVLHKHSKGRGVLVAILDTGVDVTHRDLKSRKIIHKNLVKGKLYRAEIHGTAVAGIIGARINNFGIEGIAPEAELLALRVCKQVSKKHPEGMGNTASIIKALDIAVVKNARIVNMSFGSPASDRLVKMLLKEGSARGILFVAPVGNTLGQKHLSFPASSPYVIAVGGLDQSGKPYPDKNLASQAKVCAPAVNVFTTIPNNRHNFLNGTSMSSAIISGILALAVEKNHRININKLPKFNGDICRWAEKVLRVSMCGK